MLEEGEEIKLYIRELKYLAVDCKFGKLLEERVMNHLMCDILAKE